MSTTDNFQEIRTGTADAILAGLWRRILTDYDIGPARLDDLVNQYSKKMTHLEPNKRAQFYGNVLSDLKSDQITWSTFKRGPMVLNAKKVTMTFTLHHRYCQTEHSFSFEYGAPNEPEVIPEGLLKKDIPTELGTFLANIMSSLGVDVTTFNHLLSGYMKRNKIDSTQGKRMHVRTNLRKDLLQKRLSWAGFMRGLDFLTIQKLDVKIELEFVSRSNRVKRSKHYERIILNSIEDMLADMDDSDFLNPVVSESTDAATDTPRIPTDPK